MSIGRSPGDITGAAEGLVLGGAVGLGAWMTSRGSKARSVRRSVAIAGFAGGIAGILITLLGGRMMGASLDSLAEAFPASRLDIDPLGRWFGEDHFGLAAQIGFGAVEGLLFGAAVAAAIRYANQLLREIGEG